MIDTPIPRKLSTFPAAKRLLVPFWFSKKNWGAWAILGLMFGVTTAATYLQYQMTSWTNKFMTVFTSYDVAKFPQVISLFLAFGMGLAAIAVVERCLHGSIRIIWKSWLTDRFLAYWMDRDTYYRVERDKLLDNPDQRIAEDVDIFITTCLTFTVGLYGTLIRIGSFSYKLWEIGGNVKVDAIGGITIPGYMVWCAFIVAMIELGLLHWTGRSLMTLNFTKQKADGDFRYGMASVRGSAEEIAIYGGGRTELTRLEGLFSNVRVNLWRLLFVEMRFSGLRTLMENLSSPLPLILMAPKYFAKEVTFGDMAQVGGLFGSVVSGFLWFAHNYEAIQVFRVVVARLDALQSAPQTPVRSAIKVHSGDAGRLEVKDLHIATPDGVEIASNINFSVNRGERWLVRGRSGAGKSTLLRALAGIWPHGKGQVTAPDRTHSLFLPQKSYIPVGTLKAALCYPQEPSAFGDDACRAALVQAELPGLQDQLLEQERWGQRLSLGEQQRLAIARALLQRPAFLFMDEATSALDPETEALVYERLVKALPETSIVHIAHHTSLDQFHDRALVVGRSEDHAGDRSRSASSGLAATTSNDRPFLGSPRALNLKGGL